MLLLLIISFNYCAAKYYGPQETITQCWLRRGAVKGYLGDNKPCLCWKGGWKQCLLETLGALVQGGAKLFEVMEELKG